MAFQIKVVKYFLVIYNLNDNNLALKSKPNNRCDRNEIPAKRNKSLMDEEEFPMNVTEIRRPADMERITTPELAKAFIDEQVKMI